MPLTKEQQRAIEEIPFCVDLDQVDKDDWSQHVFRVEHPVDLRSQGEDFYTLREAKACQRWLDKYAPESDYCRVQL